MRPIDLMDVLDDLPEELIAQEMTPKPRRMHVYRAAAAAACLVVTLGLVRFVWNRQQPVPPLPPDTAETACTETTAASSRAEAASETVGISAASETALQSETAAPLTEIFAESTVPVITSSVGTIADVTVPQTVAPADTGVVTETTALPYTDPTETPAPPETTDPTEITVPPETTDPTEGGETFDPAEAAETDVASTGTSSTVPPEPPQLTGFVCTLIPHTEYLCWSIQAEPDADDPADFSLEYTIDRGRYSIIGCDAGWQYRLYTLYDRTSGEAIELRQDFRRSFRFYWNDTGEQPIVALEGIRGFLAYDTAEQSYALCWDDGNYVMTVHADQLSDVDTGLTLLFHPE